MSAAAPSPPPGPPPPETLERWAFDYLTSNDLAHKLAPPPCPRGFEEAPAPRRIDRPGRPPALVQARERFKTPGPEALRSPARRAALVHTFLHHELQAAELMCWAILAFPEAPRAFRAGLAGVARDEIRHMALYQAHLGRLGCRFGDLPVRDWFWERIPGAASPAAFVAAMGIGFEGGNLDHTRRFAERFRAVGDEEGAQLQELVGAEEITHVRFARTWFATFTGKSDFGAWVAHLPAPLSPILMRGLPLDREARRAAGLSDDFLDALERWHDRGPGS
ncbi:MAG: DUF455 family protein [Byssovorax sp.]